MAGAARARRSQRKAAAVGRETSEKLRMSETHMTFMARKAPMPRRRRFQAWRDSSPGRPTMRLTRRQP